MSMGKTYFIVNTMMIRTVRLVKIMIATGRKVQVKKMKALTVIQMSYPLHIAVVSYFSWFFLLFLRLLLLLSCYEKRLLQSIYDTKKQIETIVKEASSHGRSEIYTFSENNRNSVNVFLWRIYQLLLKVSSLQEKSTGHLIF